MMKQVLYFLSKPVNKPFDTSGVFELIFSFIKQLNTVHKSQCDLGKLVYVLDFILAKVFLNANTNNVYKQTKTQTYLTNAMTQYILTRTKVTCFYYFSL